MTTTRHNQVKEFIDEVNMNELVKIEEYKGMKLKRYYFDKRNKRILLYSPIRERYQIVKPYIINKRGKNKRGAFGLILAEGKAKNMSFDNFLKFVINEYDK